MSCHAALGVVRAGVAVLKGEFVKQEGREEDHG
jgi:hypothetical protein